MTRRRNRRRSRLRTFFRSPSGVVGSVILLCIGVLALLAPVLAPWDPVFDYDTPFVRPLSPDHLLGTDDYGRDMLSRILYGARISLTIGGLVVLVSGVVGTALGVVAGMSGGRWLDSLIMRVVDITYAFPFFILAVSIMAVLGPSLNNAILALIISSWIPYARLVRAEVLTVREKDYVQAARALGVPTVRLVFRHVLPNSLGPIIVQATLGVGLAILSATALSFIGLGAQPPTPEWGAMLSEGKAFMRYAPHLTLIPGVAITLLVLSLNLIGDALRDALDPRLYR